MDTTKVIGSFTCILCLYILCLMLITLTEWFCFFDMIFYYILGFYCKVLCTKARL